MSGQYAKGIHATARHRRLIGLSSTVGAFLALGMSPLAGAPAQADPLSDWIVDLFDPADWSWLGVDGNAGLDGADWSGFLAHTAAASSPTTAEWFDTWIYEPLHQAGQDWLATQSGIEISTWINTTFGNGHYLIGDGPAPGGEGTMEMADVHGLLLRAIVPDLA